MHFHGIKDKMSWGIEPMPLREGMKTAEVK